MTKADTSVSLGLIVTELVINALKHAFPRHRKGEILVDYRADGAAWTLSVRDTGIGMPDGSCRRQARAWAPASSRRWRSSWALPSG